MLEQRIEELTTAVNNLIEVIQGSAAPENTAPAKAKKAPAKTTKVEEKESEQPKAEPEKTTDVEDVRAALIDLSKSKGKDAAKNLLADFDAAKVGDLKKSDYVKVIDVATQYREAA